jgi:uncharacterized protein (TIGR03435 family)
VPVYALVLGKGGPRFTAGTPNAGPVRYTASGRNYDVTMPNATMPDLLHVIENSLLDRPVIDRTGLTGTWNIHLVYTPQSRANCRAPEPDDIGIFTAVQEQLGLKLEPRRETMEVLVVDAASGPSGN